MEFNIDKDSNISIYMQIVNQIILAIEDGSLSPGDRLPTQRELSTGLNIARGTIQQAYEELERRGVVEINKGSGSYVSKKQLASAGDEKEAAILWVDELLEKLSNMNLTVKEIRALIDLRILEKERRLSNVSVAIIDCNPEALVIFREQLQHMENVEFTEFILDDIMRFSQPVKAFEDFDIIITTLNHYDQVCGLLYPIKKKVCKVAVSPSRETIINIAAISSALKEANIALIVRSLNFKNIILRHLKTFDIESEHVEYTLISDLSNIRRFLKEKNVLVFPQCFEFYDTKIKQELQQYIENGGKIIEFKYQIERGSLIYIEEQVNSIIQNRQIAK